MAGHLSRIYGTEQDKYVLPNFRLFASQIIFSNFPYHKMSVKFYSEWVNSSWKAVGPFRSRPKFFAVRSALSSVLITDRQIEPYISTNAMYRYFSPLRMFLGPLGVLLGCVRFVFSAASSSYCWLHRPLSYHSPLLFDIDFHSRAIEISILGLENANFPSQLCRIAIYSSSDLSIFIIYRFNCPFYFKMGACRHGDRCSRRHNKPTESQTVMIRNMYQSPFQQYSQYGEPMFDVKEAEKHFEDFWEVRVLHTVVV
jgi:hypothetical protein